MDNTTAGGKAVKAYVEKAKKTAEIATDLASKLPGSHVRLFSMGARLEFRTGELVIHSPQEINISMQGLSVEQVNKILAAVC